jgi:hypothetical protein
MSEKEEDFSIEITPPTGDNDPMPAAEEDSTPVVDSVESDDEGNDSVFDFSNETITVLSPEELQNVGKKEDTFIETPDEVDNSQVQSRASLSDEKRAAVIKTLAEDFKNSGLLPEDIDLENFDGTIEGLKDLVGQKEAKFVEQYQQNYADNFSGAKKRFLQIENAFTTEAEAMRVAQDLEFFNTVTPDQIEEDESIAKALYSQYLSAKGFNEAEINEQIEDADALGKLTDKAKESLPLLRGGAEQYIEQSRQRKAAMEQQQIEQAKQTWDQMLQSVDDREHIIKELPFNKTHKDKIKTRLSQSVYTDDNGRNYTSIGYKQLSNPREFEVLMAYYDELGLFNIDEKTGRFRPDISKLKQVAKTRARKEIDDIISDEDVRMSNNYGGGVVSDGNQHTSSIISFLKSASEGK